VTVLIALLIGVFPFGLLLVMLVLARIEQTLPAEASSASMLAAAEAQVISLLPRLAERRAQEDPLSETA